MPHDNWPLTVRQHLPPRKTTLEFARGFAHSIVDDPVFRPYLIARDRAQLYVADVVHLLVRRPGTHPPSILTMPSLAIGFRQIGDALFYAAQEHFRVDKPRQRPLGLRQVADAFDDLDFVGSGTLTLHSWSARTIWQPYETGSRSRTGGSWIVRVFDQTHDDVALVEALVCLDYRYVGPFLRNWHGIEPGRGLDIVMAILRRSFGDSVGLAVSEWKITLARPAYMADGGIVGEVLSGGHTHGDGHAAPGEHEHHPNHASRHRSFEKLLDEHLDRLQSSVNRLGRSQGPSKPSGYS